MSDQTNMPLPPKWSRTTIGVVIEDKVPQNGPSGDDAFTYVDIGGIDNSTKRIVDPKLIPVAEAPSRAKQVLAADDVLVSMTRPNLNAVAKVPAELDGAIGSTGFDVLRTKIIEPSWLYYTVQSNDFVHAMCRVVQGALYPAVRPRDIRSYGLPIPPLNEERRIVAKIEELFSDLDAGVAALERAKANLKRYRAAVLNAAIVGKLTEAWRAEHPDAEPASKLLERIPAERRQKWEADQLAKFVAAEKEPPKNWKEKYDEPTPPDTTGLPELPKGWCWASVEQISDPHRPVSYGILKPGDYVESGVPMLRIVDLKDGNAVFDDVHRVSHELSDEFARTRLQGGEVLISLVGTIGRIGHVPHSIPIANIHRNLGMIAPMDLVCGRFLATALTSETCQKQIRRFSTGALQPLFNLADLKRLAIPVPPFVEQKQIGVEVGEKLSQIDAAETEISHSVVRAIRLHQSILKQAFEGKLVPQDPNDEPISEELLNKLTQEKQTTTTSQKKRNESARDEGPGTPMDPQLTALVAPYLTGQRQAIRLHSLHFDGQFRSLSSPNLDFNRSYHADSSVSPVCLVGLNGSGKSNLIELLAVILCDLELALIGYSKIPQAIKQLKGQPFHLSFSITPKRGKPDCIIHITRTAPPKPRVTFSLEVDGESHDISDAATQLDLLPNRIVSYSSGLNETLSIPFLRNQAYYSEQVTQEAFGKRQPSDHGVKDIVTTYMDYDCNAAILLANFLFRTPKQLSIFQDAIRVKSLEAFSISYRLKRPTGGRSVQLTKELKEILKKLKQSASKTTKLPAIEGEQFHYVVDRECQRKLREAFGSAGNFFNCLNKWSQLNSLSLSKRDREYYLRSEDTSSMLERPPAVSREDRIFLIDDVQLRLLSPDAVVGYTGLSDGEHQFVQVFGSLLLFDEPGTLFLLDEPETHFNPQWRRFFVDFLNKIETTKKQEVVISTHSPFVVSGCRRDGVFKFVRNGDSVTIDRCSLETFGSSYEVLLAELFNLNAMISEQAVAEMKKVLEKDDANEIVQDAAMFGESMEKRFLFERAAEIRSGGGKK